MKVCVLGLGYIGLPTASLLAANGYEVIGVDIDNDKVQKINQGIPPFDEPGLNELMIKSRNNLIASTKAEDADIFLISVPTPLETTVKVADLKYTRLATEMIYPHLKCNNLVILESTVPPGTSEHLLIPILRKSGLELGEFDFAHCPERAIPGKTIEEMVYNDRIIGGYNLRSAERAKDVYSSFVKGNIHLTDLKTAEFVKLMENTYRDICIALVNEFAQIAEESSIDIWEAVNLANKHPRVNILKPGPGVGGHCIAVDPWFLTENFTKCKLISLARSINDSMPNHVLQMVKEMVGDIKDPVVTVFGVAYKANVDDSRESPAIKFIKLAENEGYEVRCFDPIVKKFAYELLPLRNSLEGSDCIVLIADHELFKKMDPFSLQMRNKNLVDTRNILDRDTWRKAGFNIRILGVKNISNPFAEDLLKTKNETNKRSATLNPKNFLKCI
jgi:UDP-N-acetyl-D-mannosaminuronic acid dehydrogenase